MSTVRANGIGIGYESHGAGAPLVLIAGLGYDRWMWRSMIPGLAAHFQVIAFDNRGVGESDKPEGPYTADLLADDTAGLLDALGIERAAIIGHSMGGFVAQAFALRHPQRLTKLILSATNFGGPHHIPVTTEAMAVLTDPTLPPLERVRRGIVVACAEGFEARHPAAVQEFVDYRLKNPIQPGPYNAQLAIGLQLLKEEAAFENRLPRIKAPTLILFGAEDKVVPPGNAELLAAKLPHSTVKLLPHAGHWFPVETPEAAVEAVTEFLNG